MDTFLVLVCGTRTTLEDQVPVLMSPSDRVTHLYLQALGSLFVTFYDSEGCTGGILTRLHTGIWSTYRVEKYFD
jgi:hypothetical protein